VPEEVDIIFWGYASVREDWGTTPEDSGMNPRPFLRSAAFDYRSTAQQVKNRNGVWRSAFADCQSTALGRFPEVAGVRDTPSLVIMAKMVNTGGGTPNAERRTPNA